MAIRVGLHLLAFAWLSTLALGAFSSGAAAPLLDDPDTIEAAIPPPREPSVRPDALAEPSPIDEGAAIDDGFMGEGDSALEDLAPEEDLAGGPLTGDGPDPFATGMPEAARGDAGPGAPGEGDESSEGLDAAVPPYPLVMNDHVRRVLDRFTGSRREVVGLWLNRSQRYLTMIREVLRAQGLPEELAFTAMIESGFNPLAVSRAGAKGLWQFMAGTARRYGLRVDRWVDERFDPEKSTVAAAAYLSDLYRLFGSWALAQAAYNAGELRVMKAIRAAGTTDFWKLAHTRWLKRETKEFVPQIQAATLIGLDPDRYGFETAEEAALEVETVAVPGFTSLRRLGSASGVPVDALRALNAELIRGVTPPGQNYHLKVPAGAGLRILIALARPPGGRELAAADVHVVRPRDTLSGIAKRYGVSVKELVLWNGLERADYIRPGDRIRVAELTATAERANAPSRVR